MSYDVCVVHERRKERLQRGKQPIDPIAERLLEAIRDLRASGDEASAKLAIKVGLAAMRMNCGDRYEEVAQPLIESESVNATSKYLMLSMLGGHEVDGDLAEQCLNKLDARRENRSWEYYEQWFQWEELLVIMIFGGKPLAAAQRLLTYDHQTKNHDEKRIIEALGVCNHQDALAALQLLEERCGKQWLQRDWFLALSNINNTDATQFLLTALLERQPPRDSIDLSDLYKRIAKSCNDNPAIYERVLDIARNGDQQSIQRIAGIIRNIDRENLLIKFLDLPANRLQQLGGPLSDALKELCLAHHPVGGGAFEVEAHPIPAIRAKLFERSTTGNPAAAVCTWLLQVIEEWRERYGAASDEPRHPNIQIGEPWPVFAKVAWDASIELRG